MSDEAPCPFCGRNNWWIALQLEPDPCEHIVGSWSDDTSDNGGGVLGESAVTFRRLSESEAFAPVPELARACQTLNNWISGDGHSVEERFARFQGFPIPERPTWWKDFTDALELSWGEVVGDNPESLGNIPTAFMSSLLNDVSGVTITSDSFGGMTSGMETFVWSEDRAKAASAIARRLGQATQLITSVCDALGAK